MECSISSRKAYNCTSCGEIGRRKSENIKLHAGIRQDSDPIIKIMIILKLRQFNSVFAFSVRTILASPQRREIKKMQNRRNTPRRRTSVRQRRFSAVEKTKTLFRLLKESARIPTAFRKSDYTKAVIKCLVFAFSVCAFLASTRRGEIKKMQKRRNTTRRRTGVRQRRVSAVEKADNHSFGEIR